MSHTRVRNGAKIDRFFFFWGGGGSDLSSMLFRRSSVHQSNSRPYVLPVLVFSGKLVDESLERAGSLSERVVVCWRRNAVCSVVASRGPKSQTGEGSVHFHPNCKKKLIQKHFHPKTLSSKNSFIQKHFHPKEKTISSTTLSSKNGFIQWHFHPKNGFVQWHFHPKTVSSNDTFIPNHFHPTLNT